MSFALLREISLKLNVHVQNNNNNNKTNMYRFNQVVNTFANNMLQTKSEQYFWQLGYP